MCASDVFGAALNHADRIFPEFGNARLIEGRARILAWAHTLEALAARCGRPGAFHWLHYFLTGATGRYKHPVLVLQPQPGVDPASFDPSHTTASQLRSAVLMSEYRPFRFRTRVVSTEDEAGWRSVVAMPQDRRQAAAHALHAVLASGAHLALATFDAEAEPYLTLSPPAQAPMHCALRARPVSMRLPLESSLEATLARMGRSTRVNMRYYRRKLESAHELEFVSDVLAHVDRNELVQFQRLSRYPSTDAEFLRRLDACRSRGGYISGLRVRGGPWLSFAGGWRQDRTSVLYMQINAVGWEKSSLSMVMRSFLMEDEIARGAAELLFFGGTPHPMRHAFLVSNVHDLLLRRETGIADLLVRAMPLLRSRFSPFRSNFLAGMLREPGLTWHSVPGALPGPAAPRRQIAREPLL